MAGAGVEHGTMSVAILFGELLSSFCSDDVEWKYCSYILKESRRTALRRGKQIAFGLWVDLSVASQIIL
jgi:hypothetical protein